MKTARNHLIATLATTSLLVAMNTESFAKNDGSSIFSIDLIENSDQPKTAHQKLEALKTRYNEAFSQLTVTLNRVHHAPEFLGTKELFAKIDEYAKEFKDINAKSKAVFDSLHNDFKEIKESDAFTQEQKKELGESAEKLAEEVKDFMEKNSLAEERLKVAYEILPKWNKLYKAYRHIESREKGVKQIKDRVKEYLKSFTPSEKEDGFSEAQDGDSIKEAESQSNASSLE